MKITYDREVDALYIRLLEGQYQCRVVRLTDDIALDFAAGEKLVALRCLEPAGSLRNQRRRRSSFRFCCPGLWQPDILQCGMLFTTLTRANPAGGTLVPPVAVCLIRRG